MATKLGQGKGVQAPASNGRVAKGTPLDANAKMGLLAHRLNALEMTAQGVAPAAVAPSAGQQRIGFKVSNATALVRISEVDDNGHAQVILPPGATSGDSAPHDNGDNVDFIVELSGSSGNSADIALTNSSTAKVTPSIPNDYTGSWYPIQYTFKAKW
jgi:hypothetical protein